MEWMVQDDESGLRLVDFISKHCPSGESRRAIRRALERNACLVNGRVERFGTAKVNAGDQVRYSIGSEEAPTSSGCYTFDLDRVLFEDDFILVYNKPAGISVERLQPLIPGDWQMLHRLDRYTSGVWLLAKPGEAVSGLTKQFQARKVRKRYLAIVDGVPEGLRGRIETPIQGRPAQTTWSKVAESDDSSILCCEPATGRTHQIRIHMASIGHPLLGDRDYSTQFRCSELPPHYCLHAEELHFEHPLTGEEVSVTARCSFPK